jgi:hypothetical protein
MLARLLPLAINCTVSSATVGTLLVETFSIESEPLSTAILFKLTTTLQTPPTLTTSLHTDHT